MSIFATKQKIASISLLVTSIVFSAVGQTADLYQVIDLGKLGEIVNEDLGRNAEAFAINNSDSIVGNASGEGFVSHAFIYQNNSLADLGHLENFVLSGDIPAIAIDGPGVSLAFGVNDQYTVGYSIESEVTVIIEDDLTESVSISNTEIAVFYDNSNLTISKIPQFVPATSRKARAISINNNNLIAGFGMFDPEDGNDDNGDPLTALYRRGFLYDVDADVLTMVNPLEGEDSQRNITLRDVNGSGLAVGVSQLLTDQTVSNEVVVVDVNLPEVVEKIDIFGGLAQQPWAINESGKIVGRARISLTSTIIEAFLYDSGSDSAIGLGFLNENFRDSEAFDINESDQVVGLSQVRNSPNVYHAFLYENGSIKDINKLISCEDAAAWQLSEARSINDSGIITGTGVFEGEKRAFMLMPVAGTAPNCEVEVSSDSGSVPVIGLLLLTGLAWGRRKSINR